MTARTGLNAGNQHHGLARVLRSFVSSDRPWRTRLLLLTAGALSVLSMAPFFAWPVLFLTLPVLVFAIDGRTREVNVTRAQRALKASGAGWWFGFGYFVAGLFWIGEAFLVEIETFGWMLPFAITGLPAGLAIFFAIAAAMAAAVWPTGLARILVLAVCLGATEWLRGTILTGFPWNTIGYALTAPGVMAQSAGLLGIYGLSVWTVVIFASPVVMADDQVDGSRWRSGLMGAAVAVVPLIVLAFYGMLRLDGPPTEYLNGPKLRLVQPAIAQREKWKPENRRSIFEGYLHLSRHDGRGERDDLNGITHVIWPESAPPFLLLRTPEALAAIADLLEPGSFLITGALRFEDPKLGAKQQAFNSLLTINSAGELVGQYDKIHLVPFGEYLPMQDTLEAIGLRQLTQLRGGFSSGTNPRSYLDISGLPPLSALICYEVIFPREVVRADGRPQLLLNITNDGWFGQTTGPYQHFHQARIRAVEQGVPMIRLANTGISAVIDAKGEVLVKLGLNKRGVIDTGVPAAGAATPYSHYGDWIFLINSGLFLLAAAMLSNRTVLT